MEGTMPLPGIWEEAVSWHSTWCQSLQCLPICHWCPSSCFLGAESQRGLACISHKSIRGPFRGDFWESYSFFHHPNSHWFLQPEVMETYLPGAGTLGSVVCCGPGVPHFWGISPNFYPLHMGVGMPILHLRTSPRISAHLHISFPPTHLDECSFFNSLIVRLPYSLIFWWFWVTFVF